MSDPVSNVAVEDVLSSIRRLVSEDNRFETRPAHVVRPSAQVERLILTPAQRVEPLEQDTPIADVSEGDGAPESAADPQSPWADPNTTLHDAARLADDLPDVEADTGGAERAIEGAHATDDHGSGGAEASQDGWQTSEEDHIEEAEMAEMIDPDVVEADVLAFITAEESEPRAEGDAQADDATFFAQEEVDLTPEPEFAPETETETEPESETEPYFSSDVPDHVDSYEAEFPAEADRDTTFEDALDEELASVFQAEEQADTPPEFSSVREPAEAEFVEESHQESESSKQDPQTATDEVHLEDTPSTDPADNDLSAKIRAVEEAVIRNAAGDWEEDFSHPQQPEPQTMAWQDLEEDRPVRRPFAPDALSEAEETALSDDEAVLDEEALREMVADIVRQELQGVLGERITRNVRKLVRREIQRALSAQELE